MPVIHPPDPADAFDHPEGCRILELWNDPRDEALSIARATVAPGVTTRLHWLHGITERYQILQGEGQVEVDGRWRPVQAGDLVLIPPGVGQRIRNGGAAELVFLALCTPRYRPDCYHAEM